MKELIEAIKEKLGKDILSDELQENLQSQFDIVVNEKVKEIIKTKEQELEESSEKEMQDFKESLVESLDKYIEYASDEYLKENEIAIEAESKILAAEKILEATKNVFKEVGFEIPENEVQHVKELEEKIAENNKKMNTLIEDSIEDKKQVFEYEKAVSFQNLSKNLTESKVEKVHTLLEGLEFKNIEDFERKVKIVLEKVNTKSDTKEKDDLEDLEEKKTDYDIDKYLI